MITDDQLSNWFRYHAAGPEQAEAYEQIRQAGLEMARTIRDLTPPSADQTVAIRKVREAVFAANASIACAGSSSY